MLSRFLKISVTRSFSMSSDSSEVLVELSNNEIEEFREFYRNLNDREFLHVHFYLLNQHRWNLMLAGMSDEEVSNISDRCKMKFYRHEEGKREHKTLIGITGDRAHTVFFASRDETLEELRECLKQTKLIKWELMPIFVAVHRKFQKLMYEIVEFKNLRVKIDNFCSTLWLDEEKGKKFDYEVPEGLAMEELRTSDAAMINSVWPYKYPGSEDFIRSVIRLNGGLGIKIGSELASWVLQVECFGLGLLQTADNHQGKGFARILTRALTKKISTEYNEGVILFASYSRPKTVDLYIRYGFKHISYTHWFYLKKIEDE